MYPFDFLCDTSVETLASNKIELTSFQLHTDLSTYTEALCYKQKRQTVSKFANSKLVKQGWSCREYHLLRSNPSVKKGCLSASCAVMRFAGSYLSSPCKRSMKSPADWSTFCITRFWSLGSFITAFMLSREVQPSGQFRRPFLMYFSEWRLQTRINEHTTLTRPLNTSAQYYIDEDHRHEHTLPS